MPQGQAVTPPFTCSFAWCFIVGAGKSWRLQTLPQSGHAIKKNASTHTTVKSPNSWIWSKNTAPADMNVLICGCFTFLPLTTFKTHGLQRLHIHMQNVAKSSVQKVNCVCHLRTHTGLIPNTGAAGTVGIVVFSSDYDLENNSRDSENKCNSTKQDFAFK